MKSTIIRVSTEPIFIVEDISLVILEKVYLQVITIHKLKLKNLFKKQAELTENLKPLFLSTQNL